MIEDKIISYFDGELSDSESAELLHRVSVSPEIRGLFREHEMLREMARGAARSAAISPETEASVFSRIEALAGKAVREKPMFVFSRRTLVAAALALILLSGSLGYFVPKLLSGNSQQAVSAALPKQENISQDLANPVETRFIASLPISRKVISEAPRSYNILDKSYEPFKTYETIERDNPALITPTSPKTADIAIGNNNERQSPFDRREDMPDSRQLFEASLQTSSGFTYPADQASVKPFADQRLSIGYHVTENNIVGLRITSGLYQQLGDVTRTISNGVEILSRGIETKRSFSEEIFLSHLIPISFGAPLFLEFSLDGGLIPSGYSLGAEAGVRIPISENIMFDAAFALTRIHSNMQTSDQILNAEQASKPILLESSDIHNTINGRLHYGILYRF